MTTCGICGPVFDRELKSLLETRRVTCHGHRLWLVATGTSWRFWWATKKADVEPRLRQLRYGQGALTLKTREATLADIERCLDAGGVQ